MTTLKRNTVKFAALAIGLVSATMVHAAGQVYFPYDAYEELSGTHATKISVTEKGDLPTIGLGQASVAYDAHEELSGTHAKNRGDGMGLAGKSGPAGEAGRAGSSRNSAVRSDLNKIPGDVADGCSRFLRCGE